MFALEIFVWSWRNSVKRIDAFLRFVQWVISPRARQHCPPNSCTKLQEFGVRLHWHTLPVHRLARQHTYFFSLFHLLPRWAAWAQCQFVPLPPTFACFKCDWPSEEAQMGRVGSSWVVHVSGRMTKQSWARWHNLLVGLRSADRL